MKSMLQEASTVSKAIEKAWYNAGMPKEFTIKVIEFESRNFFGMTTKPAIISINYDSKKQTISGEKLAQFARKEKVSRRKEEKAPKKKQNRKEVAAKKVVQKQQKQHDKKQKDVEKNNAKRLNGWNQQLIGDVTGWLKEIVGILTVKTSVNSKADKRILNIYLGKRLLDESEDEKLFFISLSHLLMQFLKRKYKKRFSNFYLIIHTQQDADTVKKRNKDGNSR